MHRRAFVGTLAGGLLAAPFGAEAQRAGKVPRIALLLPKPPIPEETAFLDGMRELGWVEGQNMTVERKAREEYPGRYDERLEALLRDVVKFNFDGAVGSGLAIATLAKRAPNTMAIVLVGYEDPVGAGLVKSLARPGGNVTGLVTLSKTLNSKRFQLLKEAFPRISRVAYLDYRPNLSPEIEAAAGSLGLTLLLVKIDTPEGFERAFAGIAKQRVDALFVDYAPFFWAQRSIIIEFAARQRLPAIYPFDVYSQSGGLMSYGVKYTHLYRRAAIYVDRILRGAKPGDLPIEQPTKFELVINLKTAKALGLTIPPSLLGRADEVIQ